MGAAVVWTALIGVVLFCSQSFAFVLQIRPFVPAKFSKACPFHQRPRSGSGVQPVSASSAGTGGTSDVEVETPDVQVLDAEENLSLKQRRWSDPAELEKLSDQELVRYLQAALEETGISLLPDVLTKENFYGSMDDEMLDMLTSARKQRIEKTLDFIQSGGLKNVTELEGKADLYQLTENPPKGANIVATGLGIFATLLSATGYIAIKESQAVDLPVSVLTAARYDIALMILLPLALARGGEARQMARSFIPGTMSVVGNAGQIMALKKGLSAAETSLFCSLTSIATPFFARLSGSKIPLATWLAAPLSLAGVGIIEYGAALFQHTSDVPAIPTHDGPFGMLAMQWHALYDHTVQSLPDWSIFAPFKPPPPPEKPFLGLGSGQLFALLQVVGFSIRTVLLEQRVGKEASKATTADGEALRPARPIEGVTGIISTLALCSTAWAVVDFSLGQWQASDLMAVLSDFVEDPIILLPVAWVGLISSAMVIYLEMLAFEQGLTASELGIISATEPVWAAVFGYLLLQEDITTATVVGGTMVLAACLLAQMEIEEVMTKYVSDAKRLTQKRLLEQQTSGSGTKRRLLGEVWDEKDLEWFPWTSPRATSSGEGSQPTHMLTEEDLLLVRTMWSLQDIIHQWRERLHRMELETQPIE